MKTCLSLFALSAVCSVALADGDRLERDFRTPPHDAKPHTWYHLMNGNVTKEGITADFEALAAIGIGGVQMFDAGCNIPAGPLDFNSPAWFDMFAHAAKEARRLGLEICIPNCSGWSSSGGPWNMPSNAMKFVTWRETKAKGPSHFHAKLARDMGDNGFYEDIAVLAFPTPAAEGVTYPDVRTTLATDGQSATIASATPFAAKGVSYRLDFGWTWSAEATIRLEASDDGKEFRELETFVAPLARSGTGDRSLRFQPLKTPVTARALRVSVAKSLLPITLKEAHPEMRMAISNLKAKTFEVRQEVVRDAVPSTPDQVVAKADVRDLLSKLAPDGTLDWDVPAGDWTIVRLGYKCNGRRNHPASDHGVGLEVDKLSASAMDYHFNQYVAVLCRHLGSLAGDVRTGFNNILVDSYEVGSQNWTQKLDETFARMTGYSMTPYLPVFAGRIVGSVDETERFLEDFRRVVADLFAKNYAGALADKCHQFGLKLSLEPYGNCPSDNLQYGEYVDIPMGEFWSGAGQGSFTVGEGNARFPAYIAHVWGRKFAATESFTADPGGGGRWRTTPFSIKAQGDLVYARGVNRIIYHRFTHQPWAGNRYLPGMTMGRWGMHLDRTQTWWEFGGEWIRYQSRCQAMLQAGTFVADALFFCGEQAPNQGGNTDGAGKVSMTLPEGYAWDICPTDALKKLRVEDGRVVVPGGVSYAMLVLPPSETMGARVLAEVERLLAAGAKVCGPVRPTRSPGLVGYPTADGEIAAAAGRIWAKGVMECEPAAALKRLGIAPDFAAKGARLGHNGLAYIHRREAGTDWYFVAMPNRTDVSFEASFRETGRVPEIWDAEKGTVADAGEWRVENGRTVVRLDFPVSGSAFVVFRRRSTDDHVVAATVASRPFPLPPVDDKIEIVKAEYGSFALGKTVDFTGRLRARQKNGIISVTVDNALAGKDPCFMTPKEARIVYRENGRELTANIREHGDFTVPQSAVVDAGLPERTIRTDAQGRATLWAGAPLTAELTYASGAKRTVRAEVPAPQVVSGAWSVRFPHGYLPNALATGADESVTFPRLEDWIRNDNEGVRYFSGTATYGKSVEVDARLAAALRAGAKLHLDLGRVLHFAEVTVNGKTYPALWKPPFRVDVTEALRAGDDGSGPLVAKLSVRVTNLWANRLIGDDRQFAPDCEWVGTVKKGVKEIGIKEIPQWVKEGKKSPTGRCTFTTWKHWDKNDELQSSGLLGPVRLVAEVPAK